METIVSIVGLLMVGLIYLNHHITKKLLCLPKKISKNLTWNLPPAPTPIGVYVPFLKVGKLCYVSGHGPLLPDKSLIRGRIGEDMDPDQGKLAARQVGLAILATLKHHLGVSIK